MEKKWDLSDYDHQFERHVEIVFRYKDNLELKIQKWIEINSDYLDDGESPDKEDNNQFVFHTLNESKEFIEKLVFKMLNKCFVMWKDRSEQNSDISREELIEFLKNLKIPKSFNEEPSKAMSSEDMDKKIESLLRFYYED